MPGYSSYYDGARNRRARQRGARRQADGGDAVVSAITLQVIICVLLILALAAYRKFDEEGYGSLKAEYGAMTAGSRSGEAGEAFAEAAESVSEAFRAMEDAAAGFIANLFGGGAKAPAGDPVADIPEESPAERAVTDAPAQGFDYDYLDAGDPVFTSASVPGGMGGRFPVTGEEAESKAAPTGSTLSPVVLGGYLKPPVTGLVTSPFGYRAHPLTKAEDFHTGMDIAAEEGKAVLAALPGEVEEAGESQVYGKYVVLRHAENLRTFYAHCSAVIAREGMSVRQGERIARVGETGVATGPHLHFSVIVEGQYTDPYWVLKDSIEPLK